MKEFIYEWLDPIGVVVGLIVTVPVFWTWWDIVFGRRQREQRWFREIRAQSGTRPAILIVDLLQDRDVKMAVERFRQKIPALKTIPEERIVTVARSHHLKPEEVAALQRDLRDAAARLLKCGVDTIHYFHAGPAAVAAMVGAEFANTARVLVYQHEAGEYVNFGPLRSIA